MPSPGGEGGCTTRRRGLLDHGGRELRFERGCAGRCGADATPAPRLIAVNIEDPVGNVVPGEAGFDRSPAIPPHPASPIEVGEERA